MKKEIMINASSSETRIALMEDNSLVELHVERPENERMVGDIYKGLVENVVTAIQAAFVDLGLEQNGFLSFQDISKEFVVFSENEKKENNRRAPQRSKNRGRGRSVPIISGQEILVQVTKEPIGTKGTRLTSSISLPGRFIVLVPNDNAIGVSKKIDDPKERRRLRMLAKSLKPDGFGLIIRTVAVGKDVQAIRSDLDNMLKHWSKIKDKAKKAKEPGLIHKDLGLTSSVIRDLFGPEIDLLVVDSRKLYNHVNKYLKDVAPSMLERLTLYKKKTPIFDEYGIEEEIRKSLSRKIWLKSGGHCIFDPTEAMVVVDVNSGRSVRERDHEKNALKTDMEAARIIARQLRLRDIGGIIVIDFIDLAEDANRRKVVQELKKELKKDRTAFDVLPMNDFGLVSITRSRVRPSLLYRYSEPCPRCRGLGRVPAKPTIVTQIERAIQTAKSETGNRRFVLKAHPDIVEYLTEGIRSRSRHLMMKFYITLKVIPMDSDQDDTFKLIPLNEYKNNKN
ncbi:Rne/Rng family ribonuclease [bacterium]|nr:Rne/Rng family ribonuclease [bacterium]